MAGRTSGLGEAPAVVPGQLRADTRTRPGRAAERTGRHRTRPATAGQCRIDSSQSRSAATQVMGRDRHQAGRDPSIGLGTLAGSRRCRRRSSTTGFAAVGQAGSDAMSAPSARRSDRGVAGTSLNSVVVPNVIGMSFDQARRVLHDARLVPVSSDPDGPSLFVLGLSGAVVVNQDPKAGLRCRAGIIGHGLARSRWRISRCP